MKSCFCCLFAVLLLTACTATKPPARTAEEYFRQGEQAFAKEDYQEAIEAFKKAREIYESAELNRRAELAIADAYFLDEEYVEAAAAYEDFLKQHPGTDQSARVLFQLGESYFNQILAIDRDQTATRNALVTFESLLKLHPRSPQAQQAPARIRSCRSHLAANELYVATFYHKIEKHKAAIDRLSKLLADYPDFPERDEALYLLGRSFLDNGHPNLAVETFEKLLAEAPRSPLAAKARATLRQAF
jgi:outer membrane protein assembly factor BamD